MLRLPNRLRRVLTENPYQFMLSTAWRYAAGMRGRYLLIYALFTGVNLIVSLQPIIWGYYINFLQTAEAGVFRGTVYYGLAYVGLVLASWAFQWPARLMERRMAFQLGERLLLESYDKIVHLPLPWHRDHHSGDTINRARKAHEALKGFFDNGFAYFQTLARMFFAIAALMYFSPLFGGLAGLFGIVILITVLAFDEPIILANQETNDRENELQAGLNDNLGNIITVTTLRLGQRTAAVIRERIAKVWPPFERTTRINEFKWFSVGVESGVMYALMVVGYVYQNYVPGEVFLVGGLVTLVGYVHQFIGMLNGLTAQYNQVIKFRADLAAVEPIFADAEALAQPVGTATVPRNWSEVGVSDLNFTYGPSAAGLHNLCLHLRSGARIALIGPSGSGKTTALYTLRGLYPPSSIRVTFDGVPHSPAALYAQTTLIPQTPEIFEDTLRNNLTMGLPTTEASLTAAIDNSVLPAVIEQQADGLATFLSEGGANLSGGQRQRISIARGLLAAETSTLLLLDEPTSSLDPETELEVYRRIFAAYPDKTIVSTLHRLHLLPQFDLIYYLENGAVAAWGTLEELLKEHAGFRRLYAQQGAGSGVVGMH